MASIPDKDGMEAIFFMTCKGIMEKNRPCFRFTARSISNHLRKFTHFV